ncbi:MAG: FKBP-type peptidyl-prolyl cis-trans isomerase [Candidatus Micrarchaeota archaeon]
MNKQDFIELDLTGFTEEKVFETTLAEKAKEAGFFDEKTVFKPLVVVAGVGQVVSGLDEALLSAKEGVLNSVELTPDKAFGQRNPDLIKLVPSSKFKEQGIEPRVGLVMNFDGMPGKLISVDSGRIKIDFNSPLAGKTVKYEFTVKKVYSTPAEKLSGLISNFFAEGITSSLDRDKAIVRVSDSVVKDAGFFDNKLRAIQLLLQYAEGIKTVEFVEDYSLK